MLNITTEYPILKGETEVQLASLQGTVCHLIDELKFVLPQLSTQLDALGQSTASANEE